MNNFTNRTEEEYFPPPCYFCYRVIDPYIMPTILVLGILGNILAIVVVLLTKLRRHPPSTYLIALSVSDTIFLLDQILLLNKLCNYPGICQLCIFFQYLAPFSSGWLLVGFTFERFIVVVYPMKQLRWGTWRATRVFMFVVVLLGSIMSSPYFYIAVHHWETPTEGICTFRLNDTLVDYLLHGLFYAETLIVFLIPFAIITTLNFFIILTVRRSVSMYEGHHSAGAQRLAQNYNGPNGVKYKAVAKRSKREQTSAAITKILILVSIVYVIANCPLYFVRIIQKFQTHPVNVTEVKQEMLLALQITEYPYQLYFTLNFLLYSFSSATFRGALWKLFCKCWVVTTCCQSARGPNFNVGFSSVGGTTIPHRPRGNLHEINNEYAELQNLQKDEEDKEEQQS